jgi:predicted small metal-binding protein
MRIIELTENGLVRISCAYCGFHIVASQETMMLLKAGNEMEVHVKQAHGMEKFREYGMMLLSEVAKAAASLNIPEDGAIKGW